MACRWLNEKGPLARAGMAVSMRFGSCRIPYFGVLIITILGYYIRVLDFQKLPFGFRLYIGFKFRVGHSLLDTALLRELGLGGVVLTQQSRRPKLSGTDDKIRSPQHVGHWSTDRV